MKNKLASQIGFEVATIVIGTVLTYAAYQVVKGGGAESEGTLLRYLWVAGTLAALIYMVLLFRLRKRIILPLREVLDHAEDMSVGIFQRWEYRECHNEMDLVATRMNELAEYENKLQSSWRTLSYVVAPSMTKVRDCEALPERLRADLDETWDHLRKMDVAIMGVLSPSPHFCEARAIPEKETFQCMPNNGWPRSKDQPWNRFDQSGKPSVLAVPREGDNLSTTNDISDSRA